MRGRHSGGRGGTRDRRRGRRRHSQATRRWGARGRRSGGRRRTRDRRRGRRPHSQATRRWGARGWRRWRDAECQSTMRAGVGAHGVREAHGTQSRPCRVRTGLRCGRGPWRRGRTGGGGTHAGPMRPRPRLQRLQCPTGRWCWPRPSQAMISATACRCWAACCCRVRDKRTQQGS